MSELRAYAEAEIQSRITTELPAWQVEEGQLTRRYKTGNWQGTMMLANAIAYAAEAADHHPDLVLSWGKLQVRLQTHSAGGITDKDFALAHRIEEIALWT
jgi:4a-hydroxytetrahydrobiopterin dehydratase